MHFFAGKMRENEKNFRFFGCEVEILELNIGEKMKIQGVFWCWDILDFLNKILGRNLEKRM